MSYCLKNKTYGLKNDISEMLSRLSRVHLISSLTSFSSKRVFDESKLPICNFYTAQLTLTITLQMGMSVFNQNYYHLIDLLPEFSS